jgi:hypothetical protein
MNVFTRERDAEAGLNPPLKPSQAREPARSLGTYYRRSRKVRS